MKNLAFPMVLGSWTIIVLCSLWWNLYAVDADTQRTALHIGRSFFQEIEITRLWNANHGGVYVPITAQTQPNPYLDAPDRDIRSTSGLDLTKINPAFMTRQISVLAETEAGIRYHLTSRRPIRPQNQADEWETRALEQFETGMPEVLEFFPDHQNFRYMAPLSVKESCLACHAKQGYALGDVRGGISVTMSSAPYIASADSSKHILSFVHGVFWTAGLLGLFVFRRTRERQLVALDRKNHELQYEINERVKIERQLIRTRDAAREAQRAAETANAVKSTFLANVSHEIRTPMTAILGFTEILLHDIAAPDQREYLKTIQISGHALIKLLNDILDLSKLEAGKLALTPEPTDLRQILTEIRELLLPEFQAKGLVFTLDIDPHVPQYLLLDRIRLKQILLNLIGNALKFTHRGRVIVTARSEPATPIENHEPGAAVNLSIDIADTGIGIPVEQQDVIFELFRQHEEQENRRYSGTGIGLALAQRLLDMMAGSLSVESQVGQGSVFRISLSAIPLVPEREYPLPGAAYDASLPESVAVEIPDFSDRVSTLTPDRVAEAVRVLEDQLLPDWRDIHSALIMSDVREFGQQVCTLAEMFALPGVAAYGQQLCAYAREYDIVALETLLDAFPERLEALRHNLSIPASSAEKQF